MTPPNSPLETPMPTNHPLAVPPFADVVRDPTAGRRSQARHRAEGPPSTDVPGLTRAALTTARRALTEAIHGTDTPSDGLNLLEGLQRRPRRAT